MRGLCRSQGSKEEVVAIQEQITIEVASVEVTDDYRVNLRQYRKVADYSPDQARDLANELVNAAESAERWWREDNTARAVQANKVAPVSGEVPY